MSQTLIIPALVASAVFAVVMLLSGLLGREKNVSDKVKKISANNSLLAADDNSFTDSLYAKEELSGLASILLPLLTLVGVNIEQFRKSSQYLFHRAGVMSYDAPVYYMFFKRYGIVIFLLLAYMFFSLPATGGLKLANLILCLLFVVAAFMGPEIWLSNQTSKRKFLLQRAFPDTLDLLLVCVESGLALDGALARVCRELTRAYPEMTQELNRTRMELALLNDRSQALNNLAERTDLLSFRALTTTLLQSERFGTSLTDTLRVLSEDYRNARLMLAEEKAGRLPVLMTVPLIVLMMPALFLIILGPTIIQVLSVAANQ